MHGTTHTKSAWLSLALALTFCLPASGQVLPFTHYTPDNEIAPLPSADVIDVDQDHLGFVWFTVFSSGLVRYDGHAATSYSMADGLRDLSVRTVTQDRLGRLWVASDGGLSLSTKSLDAYGPNERVRFSTRVGDVDLLNVAVSQVALAVDGVGRIWAGTSAEGIVRYEIFDDGSCKVDTISTAVRPGEPNLVVYAVEARRNGDVWAAVSRQNSSYFLRFESGKDEAVVIRAPSDEPVNVLYDAPDSSLWMGTKTGSVWMMRSEGAAPRFGEILQGLNGDVTDFNWSPEGMWIASAASGVVRLDRDRKVAATYTRRNGLLSDAVNDIMTDREGNRWFAQSGGASKLRSNFEAFRSFTSESSVGERPALPSAHVTAVMPGNSSDRLRCELWAGTFDGLACIRGDGTSRHFFSDDGLRHSQINAITVDALGRLWLGTYEGINGLRLPGTPPLPRPPERRRLVVNQTSVDVGGYRRTTILSAHQLEMPFDESLSRPVQTTWFPGYRSIYLLLDDDWYTFRATSGLPATYYHTVAFDDSGRLWVGTRDHGLYRSRQPLTVESVMQMESRPMAVSIGSGTRTFGVEILGDLFEPIWPDSPISQIESLVNIAGEMWVGTPQGLYALSQDPLAVTATLDMAEGLPASNALSIAVSPTTGNLWVGTNGGLAEVDPRAHTVVRTVTKHDGLADNEVWYYGSVHVDDRERVYYGTAKGLSIYYPVLDRSNPVAPTPRITRVSYRENAWGNNELALEYAALSFANEREVRYQSRLTGYDEGWSEPSADRRIRYTNLPAWVFSRDFTFELRASNNDGVVSTIPVSYTVTVAPPWFLRWWAFAIYLALIGGGIFGYIDHKTRVQAEQLARERKINERLRRVDRLKDEFLANTSHELRTPLNGIIGIAESMMDGVAGALSPKAMSNIGLIIASGKRLANLVNDILDFSKLKEHDLDLQLKAVDVSVLGDIVLRVSEPLIERKPLVLKNTIPRDLPPALADENRLQQILHNLIGNAIKFTHEGSVTLTGRVDGDVLRICVKDTGIGIPEEKQGSIFASFEQVDASTARQYGGTGLGLAVTKQLVDLHGGEIGVESVPDEGSTFYFTLPMADGEADQLEGAEYVRRLEDVASGEPAKEEPYEQELSTSSDGEEFSVLVVDDEPINQQVMANQLSIGNYRVTQAMNGDEALAALSNGDKFDLVLLDVMMPRMSGFEVCNKIRETYLPSELPVIMVTAKNQVSDLVEGLSSGANDYITKPISKSELLARIKTQLNLQKINAAYGRFVPHEFLRYLNRESIIDVKLGDMVQKQMTIFVSDIRQFTTLSEKMTPEENFEFINAYLAQASPVVRAHGGFIDRYTGDAIMALFPDEAEAAVKASIDTLRLLSEINRVRQAQGELPIEIGIGLHSGSLMLGIVGESERAQGDIFSDAVNLANRIEGLSKLYGASLVVSEETLSRLPADNTYHQRFLGKVQVKGKNKHVAVFEVYDGDSDEMIDLKLATKDDFEEGLDHYFGREFTMASVCFKKVLDRNPADKTANLYLRRSAQFMIQGVPDHWEGVEAVDEVGGGSPPPIPQKRKPAQPAKSTHRRQAAVPPASTSPNGGSPTTSNGEKIFDDDGSVGEPLSANAAEQDRSALMKGGDGSAETAPVPATQAPLVQRPKTASIALADEGDAKPEKEKPKKKKKKKKKSKKKKKKDKK